MSTIKLFADRVIVITRVHLLKRMYISFWFWNISICEFLNACFRVNLSLRFCICWRKTGSKFWLFRCSMSRRSFQRHVFILCSKILRVFIKDFMLRKGSNLNRFLFRLEFSFLRWWIIKHFYLRNFNGWRKSNFKC